jgi:hypothetical protein
LNTTSDVGGAGSPRPVLSVVVVIVSDTMSGRPKATCLAGCLQALAKQIGAPPLEIIVPYCPPVTGLEDLQRQYPQVVFVPVGDLTSALPGGGSREHHDELRARGLALARGDVIALLEDHGQPDEHWCARVIAAHSGRFAGCAAVGGAIENGVDRPLNWAVYFCDFGKYQGPLLEGESAFASDANVSYKRPALEAIQSIWRDVFHETAVHWALRSRGEKLALSGDVVVYQYREALGLRDALNERYVWGRSYAASRCLLVKGPRRVMFALLTPLLPAVLLARMAANAVRKPQGRRAYFVALPITALCTLSWSLGELLGYLSARPHQAPAVAAEAIASTLDDRHTQGEAR